MSAADPSSSVRIPLWRRMVFPVLLLLVILVAHGPSLHFGLFMDDYAHYQQLREADWSLAGLAAACRLELVGGALEMWWLPDCTLRFFRPVAFGLMKLVYELSDWSPMAAHAASLGWHAAVCLLLWRLMRRLGVGVAASGWATVLFALHPGHTATVQWIASQSELMVTAFALAATHLWLRAIDRPGRGAGRIAGAAAVFALALGCRENAIVLPVILLGAHLGGRLFLKPASQAGAAGASQGRAWSAFGALMATAVAYLAVRAVTLGGGAVPPRPYVVPPTAPDFVPYVLDKFLYYLLAEFWLVPAVPIGGLQYFRQVPLFFYGLSLGTAVVLGWWTWSHRERMIVRLGGLWLVLAMAPVLPVFEAPHHLYLPGVGWALLAAAAFDRIFPRTRAESSSGDGRGAATPRGAGLPSALARVGVLVAFLIFAVLSHFNTLALEAARQVEDAVVAEVIAGAPDLRDGDTIYFANLPIIAHYLKPAVEQETGRRDLRCVALTWAPRVVGVRGATECVRIDEHTLEIAIADDRFYSGPFGVLVAQANAGRHASDLLAGGLVRPGYSVDLVSGDADGIERLAVRFDEPWGVGGRHVFWGSAARWAVRLENRHFEVAR